jgi:S-methylmethionine-dependent homocysteine/selenocysteine methylase
MSNYRNQLPQLDADYFLTDGGLETTLMFHHGLDLPHFAAFVLLDDEKGTAAMQDYYRSYLDIASNAGRGFILESPTWRANPNWGARMGLDRAGLIDVNRRSIEFVDALRNEYLCSDISIVVSGNIGPGGDGYVVSELMSVEEAAEHHSLQAQTFADSGADMITAITMTYPEEATGVVTAAQAVGLPVVIGFTTETDGCLPNGQTLRSAIEQVDAATDNGPAYYMVNCAHTDHFSHALEEGHAWVRRIRGVRANASRLSHAELDECEALDDGDPKEFGLLNQALKERFPDLAVFGGCCGTDHRHIEETTRCMG